MRKIAFNEGITKSLRFSDSVTTTSRNYDENTLLDKDWYYIKEDGNDDVVVYASNVRLKSSIEWARKRTKKDNKCYVICKRDKNWNYIEMARVWNNQKSL